MFCNLICCFLSQVIVQSDFVKYEGKFEDCIRGSIETSLGRINLGTGGSDVVESLSSFGNLKKQEVDLHKLLKDVKGRYIFILFIYGVYK